MAKKPTTLWQRNAKELDQFRAEQLDANLAEGQAVTWKQGADLEQFRKEQYKQALADEKAAAKARKS